MGTMMYGKVFFNLRRCLDSSPISFTLFMDTFTHLDYVNFVIHNYTPIRIDSNRKKLVNDCTFFLFRVFAILQVFLIVHTLVANSCSSRTYTYTLLKLVYIQVTITKLDDQMSCIGMCFEIRNITHYTRLIHTQHKNRGDVIKLKQVFSGSLGPVTYHVTLLKFTNQFACVTRDGSARINLVQKFSISQNDYFVRFNKLTGYTTMIIQNCNFFFFFYLPTNLRC